MQIVIDVPYEQYEYLSKIADAGQEPLGYFERVIMRGTPLPKGHGRLIDVSPYEEYFNTEISYDDGNHIHTKYTSFIPTLIEADKENEDETSNKV